MKINHQKNINLKLPLWLYQVQRNSNLAFKTRKDIELQLITKAFENEIFKKELLLNPKFVIENELKIKLPEELKINVIAETESTVYLVLPSNPYQGLSEEELLISVGATYEDVAQWILKQQTNAFLDEDNSAEVIAEAWRNAKFKQKLLTNPKEIVEEKLGTKISQYIQIHVLEETHNIIYILIPKIFDDFEFASYSLSEDLLDVAIGMTLIATSGCCATGTAEEPVA